MINRTFFATAVALAFTATSAFAQPEATFDKTLTFTGTPTVTLSTGAGYIHVTPGPDNQFHVIGHVRANQGVPPAANADARVKQIAANPPITQSGNTITIAIPHDSAELYNNISIDYDITTPRTTTLTAHTAPAIRADSVGPNSRLDSGSGSIHATHIPGPATLETGSGSIELSLSGPGDLKVHTGSGSIHVDGLAGALQAATGSGTVEITGSPTSDWRLSSGSGGIHLKLPNDAHFNFDASTGSGSIDVDPPWFHGVRHATTCPAPLRRRPRCPRLHRLRVHHYQRRSLHHRPAQWRRLAPRPRCNRLRRQSQSTPLHQALNFTPPTSCSGTPLIASERAKWGFLRLPASPPDLTTPFHAPGLSSDSARPKNTTKWTQLGYSSATTSSPTAQPPSRRQKSSPQP